MMKASLLLVIESEASEQRCDIIEILPSIAISLFLLEEGSNFFGNEVMQGIGAHMNVVGKLNNLDRTHRFLE